MYCLRGNDVRPHGYLIIMNPYSVFVPEHGALSDKATSDVLQVMACT